MTLEGLDGAFGIVVLVNVRRGEFDGVQLLLQMAALSLQGALLLRTCQFM